MDDSFRTVWSVRGALDADTSAPTLPLDIFTSKRRRVQMQLKMPATCAILVMMPVDMMMPALTCAIVLPVLVVVVVAPLPALL